MCVRMRAVLETIKEEGEFMSKTEVLGVLRATASDMEAQAKEIKEVKTRMDNLEKKVDNIDNKIDVMNERFEMLINMQKERRERFSRIFNSKNIIILIIILGCAGIGFKAAIIDKPDNVATIIKAIK